QPPTWRAAAVTVHASSGRGEAPLDLCIDDLEGDDTDRRQITAGLLALLGVASVDGVGQAVARVTSDRAGPVDVGLVTSHEQWFSVLAGLYRTADSRVLLPVVSSYADIVLALLHEPMTPDERGRLSTVAIAAHTQSALVAYNAGQWTAAYGYVAIAQKLAEEIADPGLYAQTLGAASYLFSSALRGGRGGDPQRTRALLDQALDLAPQSEGHVCVARGMAG
ncbi:MAG: hypothetical protein ACRDZO_11310, partial [Egibacteraceae bacterium]